MLVRFSFVSFKRENLSTVPGQLYLLCFCRFHEIYFKLNIHDTKLLEQGKHFRYLYKNAGADKACRLHYWLVVSNIVDITNDIYLSKFQALPVTLS